MKAKDTKPFGKKEVLEVAERVLENENLCDHCLGRQLAQVSTGFTNEERGSILRRLLKAKPFSGKCPVCIGTFDQLGKYAADTAKRLKKLEFSTFLVGTVLNTDLVSREESLWENVGIEYCESIKSELNRELGKLIYDHIKKEHDSLNPDVTVILNLEKERTDIEVSPLFVRGKYQKLVRGLPQTKWDKYDETVEGIIASPFMLATKGDGHSLHGSGREDIDALCLDGRPFVIEIKNPAKRSVDLDDMAVKIAKSKKVKVYDMEFTDRKGVVDVKSMQNDKTYRALVEFEKPVKDIEKLEKLSGRTIDQRTPQRVEHRRADKIRRRDVISISWKKITNKKFELQIKGQAGLYIKELVSGDDGRSKPSVAGLLGNPAVVKELDVIKIWD